MAPAPEPLSVPLLADAVAFAPVRSEPMFAISLKMIAGTVSAGPQGISFRCDNGRDAALACSIVSDALNDLIQFCRLDISKDEAFDFLLKELEHIASAKFDAGRAEQNGELLIKCIDILRYGFHANDDAPATT